MENLNHSESENIDPINKLYENKYGSKEIREKRLLGLINKLKSTLADNGKDITDSPQRISNDKLFVNGRVKELDRVKDKIQRLNLSIDDIRDVWGLEIIVNKPEDIDSTAKIVSTNFLNNPSKEDLTDSNGAIKLPTRDLRKDKRGITKSTVHPDYEAVNIRRKSQYGMAEVRIMTKSIWQRIQDPNDSLYHGKYKERLKEYFDKGENK